MREGDRPPTPHVMAAGLLGVKAVLGVWAALVVLTSSAAEPHTFLGQAVRRRAGGAGMGIVVLVAATVAVIVGLLQARPWAPTGAYVLEGLAALLALSRIGTRPAAALVALVLSGAVIATVAMGASVTRRPVADPRV